MNDEGLKFKGRGGTTSAVTGLGAEQIDKATKPTHLVLLSQIQSRDMEDTGQDTVIIRITRAIMKGAIMKSILEPAG